MQVNDQLLEKFFNGDCTEAEKEEVRLYLSQHPEVLDRHFQLKNWEAFSPKASLPTIISEKMFGVIEQKIRPARTKRLWVISTAVAAATLLSLGGWWLTDASINHKSADVVATSSGLETQRPLFASKINTTTKPLAFLLPDKSAVELSPGSEIKYAFDFPSSGRKLALTGSAKFSVAADKTKPFTVYSRGGVGTTALGTIFTVTEKANGSLQIVLLEGRVVVKPDGQMKIKTFKDVYLRPGQQLLIDKFSTTAVVRPFKAANGSDLATKDNDVAPRRVFRYANQPLATVLKDISDSYRLKFVYDPNTLKGLTFTGVFDENKETWDHFLGTICLLNSLEMAAQKNTVTISAKTVSDPGLSN